MIQFKYNEIMDRYDVKAPYSLAGVDSMLTVAHIEEEKNKEARITVYRELSVNLLRQILMHWDEYEHQEAEELNQLIEDKPKNKKGDK
tara:strand:+ start:232 stop:495 length:264 start_codon:yes stop_codon:yes gene_type:complete